MGPATKEPSDEKAPLDGAETELEAELETNDSESTLMASQRARQSMNEEVIAPKILSSGEESDQPAIDSSKQEGPEYGKFSTIKFEITEDAIGPMVSENASVDQLASKSISTSPVTNLL
ncbi:hypothetical protein U1Q18_005067 [Sarracenia purpurea var. burkii]